MAHLEKKEWVDWLNTKVLQKAVVVDKEGNLLAIKRFPDGFASRPGKWDLPGGSVGPEDLTGRVGVINRAIEREVLEETGLAVQEVKIVYVTSWVFKKSAGKILGIAVGYCCRVVDIKPAVKLSNEHCDFSWFLKDDLLALDFGDDGGLHKDIVRKI